MRKLLSNAIDLGKHMDESFDLLGPWYTYFPTSLGTMLNGTTNCVFDLIMSRMHKCLGTIERVGYG